MVANRAVLRGLMVVLISTLSLAAQSNGGGGGSAPYYVVFLRPVPARATLEKSEADRIQAAHMANIHKMAMDGVLIAAGPFEDTPTTISGMFVFKVDSMEKARSIAALDPTVVEHRNTVDVHAWRGPEGVAVEYFRLHQLHPELQDKMEVHVLGLVYPGTAWEEKKSSREALLADHGRYVDQLKEQGKLGAAGRVEAPDELRGLLIFKAGVGEEAHQLLEDDPAVRAGVLRVEYHRWWSSDHVLPW